MGKVILISSCLFCLILTSCFGSTFFDEEREYSRPYNIEGVCEDGKRVDDEVFINCSSSLNLYPDGRADLTFTDIANQARYHIDQNGVLNIKVKNAIESSDNYSFHILKNGDELIDVDSEVIWFLEKES